MPDSPRVVAVRNVLTRAVRNATGIPTAGPRPGQALITDGMATSGDPAGGQMAGIAPTGSGKSLAALSTAAVGAAWYGERWIVSTESISLQTQYVTKDAPNVMAAAKEELGADIKVAVLKRWSNYLCAAKTMSTVRHLGITNGNVGYADTAQRIDRAHLKDTVFADGRVHETKTLWPRLSLHRVPRRARRVHQRTPASTLQSQGPRRN